VLCTRVHRAVKVISQITSMSILTNFPCQNQILWAFVRFLLSGVSICPVSIYPVSICPWIDWACCRFAKQTNSQITRTGLDLAYSHSLIVFVVNIIKAVVHVSSAFRKYRHFTQNVFFSHNNSTVIQAQEGRWIKVLQREFNENTRIIIHSDRPIVANSRLVNTIFLRCFNFSYTKRWLNTQSSPFCRPIGNGTKQGGILSPFLFTRYIRPLLAEIS